MTRDVLGSVWFWVFLVGILLTIAALLSYVWHRENSGWLWLILSLGIIGIGLGLLMAVWGLPDSYVSLRCEPTVCE